MHEVLRYFITSSRFLHASCRAFLHGEGRRRRSRCARCLHRGLSHVAVVAGRFACRSSCDADWVSFACLGHGESIK